MWSTLELKLVATNHRREEYFAGEEIRIRGKKVTETKNRRDPQTHPFLSINDYFRHNWHPHKASG